LVQLAIAIGTGIIGVHQQPDFASACGLFNSIRARQQCARARFQPKTVQRSAL
jgi:hypothetical protein